MLYCYFQNRFVMLKICPTLQIPCLNTYFNILTRNTGRIIVSLFLIVLSTEAFAQHYSYRHYTIFDGLPQNQCVRMFQDHNGFIWIATKHGVSRFDGKIFRTFLDGNKIQGYSMGFCEINDQLLYYSSSQIFLLNKDHFMLLKKAGNEQIYKLYYDSSDGHCYCLTQKRIFDISSEGIDTIVLTKSRSISDISMAPNEDYLIGSGEAGLKKIYRTGRFENMWSGSIYGLIKIGRKIYFTSRANNKNERNGIYCWCNDTIKTILDFKHHFQSHFLFRKGNFLYSSWDNTTWLKLDLNGNIVDCDSMPDVNIDGILADNHNNIWLNTETGLYMLQSFAFQNYDEKSGMPKYVWSIFEDSSHAMIFASYNGVLMEMKNEKLKEVENYKNYISTIEQFYFSGICNSFGQWMIPTNFRILINDKGIYRFLNPMHNDKHVSILSLYEDKSDNNVYIGTTYGLYVYNLISKYTKHFDTGIGNVLDIEKDRDGRFWIATGKNIFILEKDVLISVEKAGIEIEGGAMAIKQDFNGNMWYAAKGELHFNFHQGDISISDKQYYFISEYKKKYIIAGSIEGFLLVDLNKFYAGKSNSMRFFDRFNGFTGIECGQNGTCIDTKGNVWIPTSESVVKFMPERLSYDTTPPPVYFYSFEAAEKDLEFDTICTYPDDPDTVYRISHSQNNVHFTFQALSYPCPERIRYRYRLTGSSDIWHETSEGEVTYTNLEPGNYSIEVLACNENGFWTRQPAVLSFRIVPAFRQTLFFKIAILLLLSGSVGFVVFLLMKRKRLKEKKEREVERQLVNMQVSTINSQLDPHFIFNAITAIGSEVQEKNTDTAYAYFVKVSQLLRNSLKNGDKITRTLAEEIQFIENYLSLQEFRFGNRISYEIKKTDAVDLNALVPKMCIQIFVENAVKHGLEHKPEGGYVEIAMDRKNDGLHVSITDNGVGRSAAASYNYKSTGIGLKVFRDFFDIMNRYNTGQARFEVEDLYDENGNGAGTSVELFIPENYKYVVN